MTIPPTKRLLATGAHVVPGTSTLHNVPVCAHVGIEASTLALGGPLAECPAAIMHAIHHRSKFHFRDEWRGWLQLPPHLPPQPPKTSPSGLRGLPHLYTCYPYAGPLLSSRQGWRAEPSATAPPSPARATLRNIETFRRLSLLDQRR